MCAKSQCTNKVLTLYETKPGKSYEQMFHYFFSPPSKL